MGGAERQALYFAEYLKDLEGCDVEVLAFEDGSALRVRLEELNIKTYCFPYYFRWPRKRRYAALIRIAWLVRSKARPDALLPFVSVHSKTAGLIWKFSGARFCWWNQQDEGRDLGGTIAEKRIIHRASVITSNSYAGQDFLATTYDLHPDRIVVYNNGTPVPAQIETSDIRSEQFGLPDRAIVSMIANVTSYKDHRTLLKAWPTVLEAFPLEKRPVLVLAGHLRETVIVTDLKLLAFELGLSSNDVRFLGPISNISDLIAASDLVVHSSKTEGCPNAVCEAMAHGRAIVATDIPGCRQALGEAGAEWLAPPDDAHRLAQKIIKLLLDESLRKNVGLANRQRIIDEFSIQKMNEFFRATMERGLGVGLS
jgi:glycosyltransferase involved in cell wall biosynthesis